MRLGAGDSSEGTTRIEAPGPLGLRYLAGTGRRLVVSFSGVGVHRRLMPAIEFRGSASAGGRNHVLFVTDESRSWLTAPGMAEAIIAAVRRIAAGIERCRVSLLGNSMGGFMALRMADALGAASVLAISPQYSPHGADVPEETRWTHFRDRLPPVPPGRPAPLDRIETDGRLVAILHGGGPLEMPHASRFPRLRALRHFVLPGGDHSVAGRLKRQGRLDGIVRLAVGERPVALGRCLRREGFVPIARHALAA